MGGFKLKTPRKKKRSEEHEENIAPNVIPALDLAGCDDEERENVDEMFLAVLGPNNVDVSEEERDYLMTMPLKRKKQLIRSYKRDLPAALSPRGRQTGVGERTPESWLDELRTRVALRYVADHCGNAPPKQEETPTKRKRSRSVSQKRKKKAKAVETVVESKGNADVDFARALRVKLRAMPAKDQERFLSLDAMHDLTNLLESSSERLLRLAAPTMVTKEEEAERREETERELLVQFEAMLCLKTCMKRVSGLEYILCAKGTDRLFVNTLALCVTSKTGKTAELALRLLAVMAVTRHGLVMDGLIYASKKRNESYPFFFLLLLLHSSSSSVKLIVNALTLANALIQYAEEGQSSETGDAIRGRFYYLGIGAALAHVRTRFSLPEADASFDPASIEDKQVRHLWVQLTSFDMDLLDDESASGHLPVPDMLAEASEGEGEYDEFDDWSCVSLSPVKDGSQVLLDVAHIGSDDYNEEEFLAEMKRQAFDCSRGKNKLAYVPSAVAAILRQVEYLRQKSATTEQEMAEMREQHANMCSESQMLRQEREEAQELLRKATEEERALAEIRSVVSKALEDHSKHSIRQVAAPMCATEEVTRALDEILRSSVSPFAPLLYNLPGCADFQREVETHDMPSWQDLQETFEPWQHHVISSPDVRGLVETETDLLKKDVATWRELYEDEKFAHTASKRTAAEEKQAAEEKRVSLITDLKVLNCENEDLRRNVRQLNESVRVLEAAKAAAESQRTNLAYGRIQELEEQLLSALAEQQQASEALAEQEEAYQTVSKQLVDVTIQMDAQRDAMEEGTQVLAEKLAESSSKVTNLEEAVEELEVAKAALEAGISEREQQILAIKEQLDLDTEGEEVDVTKLKAEIGNLKSAKITLQALVEKMEEEKRTMASEIEELQASAAGSVAEIARKLEDKEEELSMQAAAAAAAASEADAAAKDLQEALAAASAAQEAAIAEMKEEVTKMEAEMAAKEAATEALVAQELQLAADALAKEHALELEAAEKAAQEALEAHLAAKEEDFSAQLAAAKQEEKSAAQAQIDDQVRDLKAAMAKEREEVRKELEAAKEAEEAAKEAFLAKKKELMEEMDAFKEQKAEFEKFKEAERLRKEEEEKQRKAAEEEKAAREKKEKEEAEAMAAAAAAAPPPPPMPMGGPGMPPPPPGMPGMPPPPPGMGGAKAAQVLPEGCDKVPSVKMRSLQWKKLAPYKVQNTVFASAKTPADVAIPVEDLERLFCAAQVAKTEKTEEEAAEEKKKQANKPVSLIDARRSQNLAILLSTMKATYKEVRNAVIAMDESFLTPSTLRQLIKLAPSDEDMDVVRSYQQQNPDAKFGPAEAFYLVIGEVPALQERLTAILFKQELGTKLPELKAEVEIMRGATMQAKKAEKFPSVLKLLLHFGNFMNGGTFRGRASGFQLSSILTLKDTKSQVDPRMTLLHFIVAYVYDKHADLAGFVEELSISEKASRLSYSTMVEEITKVRKEFNSTLQAVANVAECEAGDGAPKDNFAEKMMTCLEANAAAVTELEEMLKATTSEFQELAAFYGEADAKTMQPNEFFQTLHRFRTQFQLAKREQEQEAMRKEREASRLAEREKRRQSLAIQKNSPRKSVGPAGRGGSEEDGEEDCVVDSIFKKIRAGDFNRARRRSSMLRSRVAPRQSLSYTGQMGEVSPQVLKQRRQSVARAAKQALSECTSPGITSPISAVEEKEVFAIFNNIKKQRTSRLSHVNPNLLL